MSESFQNTRVYSGEFEYGLMYNGNHQIPSEFWKKLPNGLDRGAGVSMRQNGSRIYPDCGHVEYAMPECGTLDDYVNSELAGEEIICDTIAAVAAESPNAHFRVQKRAIDSQGTNYGSHESYNVLRKVRFDAIPQTQRDYNIQALAALYTARMAVLGAGCYDMRTNDWKVSQRYRCFNTLSSQICHSAGSRPLVDTRNESFTDDEYRRLHVSSGDPNISPWALRAKPGLTSAFLRLLEQDIDVSGLFLANSVAAARLVAEDTSLRQTYDLEDGNSTTAMNQLEAMTNLILSKHEKRQLFLPDDELEVVEEINSISTRATIDADELLFKSDWLTRMRTAEGAADKRTKSAQSRETKLARADHHYDTLALLLPGSTPGPQPEADPAPDKQTVVSGFGKAYREKGRFGHIDTNEIKRLRAEPPESSRARLRGKLIAAGFNEETVGRYGNITHAYWDTVKFSGLESAFDLLDPTRTRPTRVMRRLIESAGIEI